MFKSEGYAALFFVCVFFLGGGVIHKPILETKSSYSGFCPFFLVFMRFILLSCFGH